MSAFFSKSKEKRSRSSSNDTNNSFVKNVTAKMSGLLPSTITKWFSNPSLSNENGSSATADATDSSTDEEATEPPVVSQPPLKRMRLSSPNQYHYYNSTPTIESNSISRVTEPVEASNSFISVQNYRKKAKMNQRETELLPSYHSPSTSTETKLQNNEKDMLKSPTFSSTTPSVATKRKSLFGNDSTSIKAAAKSSDSTVKDPRQPCFKPSLLGSPFYPGQTMYGGAASSYLNKQNITHSKVTVTPNESTDSSAISHSAKKILDLLENYSSIASEARRVPYYVRKNETVRSMPSRISAYKTQELQIPSLASILSIKQRSRLMNTTNAARQLIASHSSASTFQPYSNPSTVIKPTNVEADKESSSSKLTTKVKARLTRPLRCSVDETAPEPLNLPSAQLQIDQNNLPKFSFGISVPSKEPVTPLKSSTIVSSTPISVSQPGMNFNAKGPSEALISKPAASSNTNTFKFSNPVQISMQSNQVTSTPPKFMFGSPERNIDKPLDSEKCKEDKKPHDVLAFKPSPKDWQCPDCWVFNKPDIDKCVCCGTENPLKKNKSVVKCIVCKISDVQKLSDKCVNCEKSPVKAISVAPLASLTESSKWKCTDCWLSNELNADKCVCCGAKNPKNVNDLETTKSVEKDWKCNECWISNKSNADQCAACGTKKPGTKPSLKTDILPTIKPPDGLFKNIVKNQAEKWECINCLVRNDSNRDKCSCCESSKPGTIENTKKEGFNFGVINTTFKFGIDPKAQTNVPAKVNSTECTSKPEESETNNNILNKPAFSFSAPTKTAENKTDPPVVDAPKVNFSFGIPTSASQKPEVMTSPFSELKKLENATKEDKQQEVPVVDFNTTATDITKPGFSFSPSPSKIKSPSALRRQNRVRKSPETNSYLKTMPFSAVPEDKTSNQLVLPDPKSSVAFGTVEPTGITFSQPTNNVADKPATLNFQDNKAAVTTSSLVFNPISASNNTLPTLFPNQTKPLSSTLPATTAASLFSFGTNATSNAPTPKDNSKFNFTFGSNNTETPSMFKQTFGTAAPKEATTISNNFSLPNTNTLSSNVLGSNNVLSNTNSINSPNMTSILSSDGLASSTITGKAVPGNNTLPNPTPIGGISMTTNPLSSLQTSNSTPSVPRLFGAPAQNENNIWQTPNDSQQTNLFSQSAASSQKPAPFSFKSPTPFNPAASAAPVFGVGDNQAAQNIFRLPSPNQGPALPQQSLFASTPSNTSTPNIFGGPPAGSSGGASNIFGVQQVPAALPFGTPSQIMPTFEAPPVNPNPAPAFNFGAPQQPGLFGFGQNQQQAAQGGAPAGATGVYSFGNGPQVQFTLGAAPNIGVRRVRKAVRRNSPR